MNMDPMTDLLKYLDDDREVGVVRIPADYADTSGLHSSRTTASQEPTPRNPLVVAYTDFLQQQDVTHYFTLTCAGEMSAGRLYHYFNDWIDGLEWIQGSPLGWFRADELKRWAGFRKPAIPLHFHGLLIKAHDLNIAQAQALWRTLAGDADVQPYDPSRGAIPYCLKQAFHQCGNYDLGGNKKAFRSHVE